MFVVVSAPFYEESLNEHDNPIVGVICKKEGVGQ